MLNCSFKIKVKLRESLITIYVLLLNLHYYKVIIYCFFFFFYTKLSSFKVVHETVVTVIVIACLNDTGIIVPRAIIDVIALPPIKLPNGKIV